MSDQVLLIDNLLLNKFFLELIIPIIVFSITTYFAISRQEKSFEIEKNQYLNPLKQNSYIFNTFRKIDDLNYRKSQSVTVFLIGTTLGLVYFLVILLILTLVFPYVCVILNYLGHFFLNIEPINEGNLSLIFGAYLNFSVIPLAVLTVILFHLTDCENEVNIIKPYLIKRKKVGKKIQVLKFKLWSLVKISKPSFTNEMFLTKKSIAFFYLFPALMALFLTTNFFIYYLSFAFLIEMTKVPFSFSLGYLQSVYMSTISVLGNGLFSIMCVYSISLIFVTLFCLYLYQRALHFLKESKSKIIKTYSEGYPFVQIKTSSGSLEGKIEDVFNEHCIILNDNGTKRITLWNRVGIIEINEENWNK